MTIRQFRPMTAGTRFRSVSGFDEITRGTPEKSLLEPLTKSGGRNNQGHLTSRHRGGGHGLHKDAAASGRAQHHRL